MGFLGGKGGAKKKRAERDTFFSSRKQKKTSTTTTLRHLCEASNAYDTTSPLHTFSIGIAGSPDLVAARSVADHLGTTHHEFTFTVEEGIDALSDLVWHIESFEQVRAAVPMYLLSRKIKALGFKVVLSGEGADEIFGGYLYFHKAPSAAEFHAECVRKVTRLHQWDVLRVNKVSFWFFFFFFLRLRREKEQKLNLSFPLSFFVFKKKNEKQAPFAWGLEPRVPFLDRGFLDATMTVDPTAKMIDMADKSGDGKHARMEKYLLRKAFDAEAGGGDGDGKPYLPESVLWRQKEQFSDGVGYDWVDGLKDYAAMIVDDAAWERRAERFPEHTPATKEYYLLRSIFEKHYPSKSALETVPKGLSIACSTPEAVSWDPSWAGTHEISGRAMKGVHDAADGFKE